MCRVPIFTSSRVSRSDVNSSRANVPTGDVRMILHFRCCTQQAAENDHALSARGGHLKNGQYLLPRWKLGSVLTFTINKKSFPKRHGSDAEMYFLERALTAAANDWNSKGIGVYFRPAAEGERAVFDVKYKRGSGSSRGASEQSTVTYATAFFPNSRRRVLRVFDTALAATCPQFLADVLRHEFGHILGLRHEDAEANEGRIPSVELAPPNEASIMTTNVTPGVKVGIQASDIAALRRLYALGEGSMVGGFEVMTVDPATMEYQAVPGAHTLWEDTPLGETSLVGAETKFGVHGHTTTIAVCVVSVCVLLVFVMTPRITVTCSSHVHDGRQWRNWDGWFPGAV